MWTNCSQLLLLSLPAASPTSLPFPPREVCVRHTHSPLISPASKIRVPFNLRWALAPRRVSLDEDMMWPQWAIRWSLNTCSYRANLPYASEIFCQIMEPRAPYPALHRTTSRSRSEPTSLDQIVEYAKGIWALANKYTSPHTLTWPNLDVSKPTFAELFTDRFSSWKLFQIKPFHFTKLLVHFCA